MKIDLIIHFLNSIITFYIYALISTFATSAAWPCRSGIACISRFHNSWSRFYCTIGRFAIYSGYCSCILSRCWLRDASPRRRWLCVRSSAVRRLSASGAGFAGQCPHRSWLVNSQGESVWRIDYDVSLGWCLENTISPTCRRRSARTSCGISSSELESVILFCFFRLRIGWHRALHMGASSWSRSTESKSRLRLRPVRAFRRTGDVGGSTSVLPPVRHWIADTTGIFPFHHEVFRSWFQYWTSIDNISQIYQS